jgi:hypothetical protein
VRRQTVVSVVGVRRVRTILPNIRVRESFCRQLLRKFSFIQCRHILEEIIQGRSRAVQQGERSRPGRVWDSAREHFSFVGKINPAVEAAVLAAPLRA